MIDDRTDPRWQPKGPAIDWAEYSLRKWRERRRESYTRSPIAAVFWSCLFFGFCFVVFVVALVVGAL